MEDSKEITTATIETGETPISLVPDSERISVDSRPTFTLSEEEKSDEMHHHPRKEKHKKDLLKKKMRMSMK